MRRALSKAILNARSTKKSGNTQVPTLYVLEQLAARWGVPPWVLEVDDPLVGKWIKRGLIFRRLES